MPDKILCLWRISNTFSAEEDYQILTLVFMNLQADTLSKGKYKKTTKLLDILYLRHCKFRASPISRFFLKSDEKGVSMHISPLSTLSRNNSM